MLCKLLPLGLAGTGTPMGTGRPIHCVHSEHRWAHTPIKPIPEHTPSHLCSYVHAHDRHTQICTYSPPNRGAHTDPERTLL